MTLEFVPWTARAPALLLSLWLSACAAPNGVSTPPVQEVLDSATGETLYIVQRPIVLARLRLDAAHDARDYVTLTAVEEDRSGELSMWLIAHHWSSLDPSLSGAVEVGSWRLHILADAQDLELRPVTTPPDVLARADIFRPQTYVSQSAAFAADAALLRVIASAQTLSLRYEDDPVMGVYTMWLDGSTALTDWLNDPRRP